MHEINIAKKILVEAKKLGAKEKILLEVGELCNITPKEIKEVIERLENIEVKIIVKSGIVECSCGYKGKPKILEREHDFLLFVCPKCGKIPKVLEGNKIKILEVR